MAAGTVSGNVSQKDQEITISLSEFGIFTHVKDVLHQLNEYRRSNFLCDAVIVAEGREFLAHSAVLAAVGGFFSGLFAAKMKEQTARRVELSKVDPEVVEDLLKYIYTGEIELTRDNAYSVAFAADFLLLDNLKIIVDEELSDLIEDDPPNKHLESYQFAVRHNYHKARHTALKLVRKNFQAVVEESQEFSDLSAETVEEIICSDELVVSSEEVVFRAIIDWFKYKEERKEVFHELFCHVRLCSLSEEFINSSVLTESLVFQNPKCLAYVLRSVKSAAIPTTANEPHPRSCTDPYTNTIIVFPRYETSYVCKGPWCYVPSEQKWYQIPFPADSKYHSGFGIPVYYQGSVYVVKCELSQLVILRLELEASDWSRIATLEDFGISKFNVACLNGMIYIIGGQSESKLPVQHVYACNVTERDLNTLSSISKVSPLNECRLYHSVAADKEHVYVFGGVRGVLEDRSPDFTNTLERYNQQTDSWTYLSALKANSLCGQCTLVSGKIFAMMASRNDSKVFSYAYEVYEISTDTWTQISVSPPKQLLATMCVLEDIIYLVSCSGGKIKPGHMSKPSVTACAVYNLKTSSWREDAIATDLKYKNASAQDLSIQLKVSGTAVRLRKKMIASMQKLEDVEP